MEQRRETRQEYLKRVNIVVEYINAHLGEAIDLEHLAEICCFSKWHFQRIMRAYLGESIGSYISRIRVETAAMWLRHSEKSISEVAYKVGFDMPSSLSKAFRAFYGVSPSEYRNDKTITIMKRVQLNTELNLKAPKVQTIQPQQAIYLKMMGAYKSLDYDEAWGKLWQFVKENKLFGAGVKHIAIYYDDPRVTEESKLRTDICLVVPKKVEPKGEIGVKTIEGGKYAVFLYTGSYDHLEEVYDTIYAKWLPESGEKLRNYPCYELYINDPSKVSPDKLKTEIYVPIE